MRRLFLLTCLLCYCQIVGAQDYGLAISPHAGVNIANITKNRGNARAGFAAGITGIYRISQEFGVSGGVTVTEFGYYTRNELEAMMTYLEVPLELSLFVGKREDLPLRVRFHAGLAPVILLQDCGVAVGRSSSAGLHVVAGYAIEYRLWERLWFQFDGRGQAGLTDYRREDERSGERSTIKNLRFTIGLGYVLR